MIWENAYEINFLINELVTERFGSKYNCDKSAPCGQKYEPSNPSVECSANNVGVSCGDYGAQCSYD